MLLLTHKTFDTSFIDTDIIQINHYKCKTFDEYKKNTY